jgi:hypothetical protein
MYLNFCDNLLTQEKQINVKEVRKQDFQFKICWNILESF